MGTVRGTLSKMGKAEFTRMEPLHDRVLVERFPEEEKVGSIYIPDTARDIPVFCKVLAVGPGRWFEGAFCKTVVKPGDTVLVPGAGNKFPDWKAGETILITEQDIGAIVAVKINLLSNNG